MKTYLIRLDLQENLNGYTKILSEYSYLQNDFHNNGDYTNFETEHDAIFIFSKINKNFLFERGFTANTAFIYIEEIKFIYKYGKLDDFEGKVLHTKTIDLSENDEE